MASGEPPGTMLHLFRAIVVLLHATFEDSLRTAARQRLGDAAPKVLDDLPLAG
jgi:hypothetical protein